MASLAGFDANSVAQVEGSRTVPDGDYAAIITGTEFRHTKRGNGRYLNVEFEIVGGRHHGRRLRAILNLENENSFTMEMARAELGRICRAVGVMAPNDSCELHCIPLVVTVGHRIRADNGEEVNFIRGYRPIVAMATAQQLGVVATPAEDRDLGDPACSV